MNAGQYFASVYAESEIPRAMAFIPRKPEQPEPAPREPKQNITERALRYVTDVGRTLSVAEVAEGLGANKLTVSIAMLRLYRRGDLVRSGEPRFYRYRVA